VATETRALRASGAVERRQIASNLSRYVFLGATLLGVSVLAFLAYDTIKTGRLL
jgi:hypothetical protein